MSTFLEHDPIPDGLAEQVRFDVTLRDGSVERVHGADAYEPERSMTTFFRTDGRPTVDCWSIRMASFRTEEILAIRRCNDRVAHHTDGAASGGLRLL